MSSASGPRGLGAGAGQVSNRQVPRLTDDQAAQVLDRMARQAGEARGRGVGGAASGRVSQGRRNQRRHAARRCVGEREVELLDGRRFQGCEMPCAAVGGL